MRSARVIPPVPAESALLYDGRVKSVNGILVHSVRGSGKGLLTRIADLTYPDMASRRRPCGCLP